MRVAELERRLENQRTNINNAIALHNKGIRELVKGEMEPRPKTKFENEYSDLNLARSCATAYGSTLIHT